MREVHGGESFDALGFRIKTAAVNHTIETIAYRFELGGKTVVVSGDLYYSDSLVDLAKGADLLILDGGAVVDEAAIRVFFSEAAGATIAVAADRMEFSL